MQNGHDLRRCCLILKNYPIDTRLSDGPARLGQRCGSLRRCRDTKQTRRENGRHHRGKQTAGLLYSHCLVQLFLALISVTTWNYSATSRVPTRLMEKRFATSAV